MIVGVSARRITLRSMAILRNVPGGHTNQRLLIDEVIPRGESGGLKARAPEPLRDLGGAGNPSAVSAKRGVKLQSHFIPQTQLKGKQRKLAK